MIYKIGYILGQKAKQISTNMEEVTLDIFLTQLRMISTTETKPNLPVYSKTCLVANTTKRWKQSKCPLTNEQIKQGHIYMEYV